MKKLVLSLIALAGLMACESGFDLRDVDFSSDKGEAAPVASDGGSEYGEGQPGVVTAAEWCDLDHWPLWGKLMHPDDEQDPGYVVFASNWGFWTGNRVAVKVTSGDNPAIGVKVSLLDGDTIVWTTKTDNHGRADCWAGLHKKDYKPGNLSIRLNDEPVEGTPEVTTWSSIAVSMNEYTFTAAEPENSADILFIVDATGSMSDELEFLKADLTDILARASSVELPVAIRTGALFYRDKDDEYVTRRSPFTSDFDTTIGFIDEQSADGGGDWPEAVHTALAESLQDYDWNENARARLAFIILDAPPHEDHQGVVQSVQKSIDKYAEMGIKLIPVASSGVDKSLEFLLRLAAISTNSTYVFITNDSGVGNNHEEPTVGEYQIEKLNDLMVRLIQKYLE